MVLQIQRRTIYVRPGATVMPKQINSLAIMVEDVLEYDPFNGAYFMFCNRRRDKNPLLGKHRILPVDQAFGEGSFSPSSEKWSEEDKRQMHLFDEAESIVESEADESEKITYKRHKRGRKFIPADIPSSSSQRGRE